MNQELISVISAFFGSLGFSIIYNIRGLDLDPGNWRCCFLGCVSDIPSFYK